MKQLHVSVPWPQGLHLRPASALVRLARRFRSRIHLLAREQRADARSLLSLLLLCATCNTPLLIEVEGEDEEAVIATLANYFTGDPEVTPVEFLPPPGDKSG